MSPPELLSIRDPHARPLPGLSWHERLDGLGARLESLGRVVVAYSGGVDSSLVLRVAHERLGDRAIGVIGRSDSYSSRELELALAQGRAIGARVEIVTTGELADPAFAANAPDRCYHCKSELYRQLRLVAGRVGADAIVDGTIFDDLSDHRPGRRAADESDVISPLADLGFTKADVRAAAAHLGLASSGKPASPCLASRIPYGTPITREALAQVERAEDALRGLGFDVLRVRHHGDVARIEVPLDQLAGLLHPATREAVVAAVRGAGFTFVSLDLEGFRSGALNRTLEG
ncbi:MAG TPA: ATP-dependent sacrificial sulfur transferase LarE [Candidatus Acidoferrales bacterium]|nr:ATP-dependent sacrificial sulfur transferase LarE [Candidatus Acidoferrales bacterium]